MLDRPELNKSADALLEGLRQYSEKELGQPADAKVLLKQATDILKGRLK